MLYAHYSECPDVISGYWKERWPNFSPIEVSCRCCGEYYHDPVSMDFLQRTRTLLGQPAKVNCGHRCKIHNARVGGAPLSEHKKMAFDLSLRGQDRQRVFECAREAGFTTFGFYRTFIHVDRRPGRRWYGKGAQKLWNG